VTWTYTPYAGVLHATTVISALIGFLALRRRKTPGGGILALLMFAVAEWAFASGLEAAAVGIPSKIFWSKIEYLGSLSAPTLFLLFALEYSQKKSWRKPIYLTLLSIVPIIGFIVTATQWHGLIWSSLTPDPALPNVLIYGHGIGYYILIVYDYLIISTGIVALVNEWFHSKQPFHRQVGILLLGSLFPFAAGLIYTLFPKFLPGLDLTPVSFSLTGLVIAFGILKFRLFNLTPIARDVLVENMDEGILVLDAQNQVVDINPVAEKILGISGEEILGHEISELDRFWLGMGKRLEDKDKIEMEFRMDSNPPRYIHLHISLLFDQRKHLSGRLLVFRDVSRRKQAETELAHTIEELRIINHISLTVTAGLDMEHVLKTLYEQCSRLVPIDIFYVALYNEANSLINIPLFYERGHFQIGPSRDINDRPGMLGTIIRSRKTLYINNTVKSETRPLQQSTSILDKPTRSYIGIPLTLRERVIGVISIQNYRPDVYTEDHIRMLERIAIHAAIAIENARLYAEVQRLAIIDELTGLYNYRGLQELGAREVERAHRFSHPLSALFFDIDDFRNFNNQYNHSTGNIILQTISRDCQSILRKVDVLARYGGDEFVALLPETDITSAEAIARRMADRIAADKITTTYGELGVTISIGVTELSDENTQLSTLIDRANNAEHQAKQGQKGIVVVAR
jgi:diguanylate cyclase (GGDEF)-like protein/PAS domain S-box-containing protein